MSVGHNSSGPGRLWGRGPREVRRRQRLARRPGDAGETEMGGFLSHVQEVAGFTGTVERLQAHLMGARPAVCFSLRRSGDSESVGWDCSLSPALVILILCGNHRCIWESAQPPGEGLSGEKERREGRGSGRRRARTARGRQQGARAVRGNGDAGEGGGGRSLRSDGPRRKGGEQGRRDAKPVGSPSRNFRSFRG